jgi:mxaJ protein
MLGCFSIFVLLMSLTSQVAAWDLRVCANPNGLPYSNSNLDGFDNKIILEIARAVGASVDWVWMPNHRHATARTYLQAGECDVVMGVAEGQSGFLTTHAIYRSFYVFATRTGADPILSVDDPHLKTSKIGVIGGATRLPPPAVALARRGMLGNLSYYGLNSAAGSAERELIDAVIDEDVDVAVLWGPMLSLFDAEPVTVRAVTPEIDIPFLPMFATITIGVRPHDEALRDALNHAIAQSWPALQEILGTFKIPLMELPRPIETERAY